MAAVPLLLAVASVGWVVTWQAEALARQQIQAMQPLLMNARKDELQHFVQVGRRAIEHLQEGGRTDEATRRGALELLRRMDFGDDNYFFVYDLEGRSLMHPRLAHLEGKSQWDLKDAAGTLIIQRLIAQARVGGGFVDYFWNRPSTRQVERKLGYVELVPEWGWMIGTGLYLDHVAGTEALIRKSTERAIARTRDWILAIAALGLLMVFACGLALTAAERRQARVKLIAADSQLRLLAQQVVLSQEVERKRVSRDLHDGVMQWLTSVKFVFESVLVRLERGRPGDLEEAVEHQREGLGQLRAAMRDVRAIAQDLRPPLLDDLGLGSAIEQLGRKFEQRSGIRVDTRTHAMPPMPDAVATAVFRVAQEALGNVERHAGADHVVLELGRDAEGLRLRVCDNGRGFDPGHLVKGPHQGLGLSSMRERIEMLSGRFELQSSPGTTVLTARLPVATLQCPASP